MLSFVFFIPLKNTGEILDQDIKCDWKRFLSYNLLVITKATIYVTCAKLRILQNVLLNVPIYEGVTTLIIQMKG